MPDRGTTSHDPARTREVFRARGLRFTAKRARIYETLAATDTHPTAHELLGAVRGLEPRISLATVYNTLDALTSHGLCRRFPGSSGAGPCRYDADVGPHVHVVGEDGRVMDVPSDLSRRLLAEISAGTLAELEARLGIRVTEVDVKLVGRTV
jgi:Fe2+ or Zn2+ uptake regulation protein